MKQGSNAVGPQAARGIFLHTGWRSAGTWVWSRFRADERFSTFYEPLSPVLADLSIADLPVLQPTLTSGHPPLKRPYYDEYRNALMGEARGVAGYRKAFATDRFGASPDAEFGALTAYMRQLCEQASQDGRLAVFKFCRSQGRMPWFRTAFPDALHAFVLRNPASQFASGWLLRQQWANAFFVAAPFRVLGLNQHDESVRAAIDACGVVLPPVPVTHDDAYAAACEQYGRSVEAGHAYRAFVALWALCAARLLSGADLVIDMDQLGDASPHQSQVTERLRAYSDAAPALEGARNLVDETRRAAPRMAGVDGRALRSVHSAAFKLVNALAASPALASDEATRGQGLETIRAKLILANELADQWR